jgi:putative transcriptional regulator
MKKSTPASTGYLEGQLLIAMPSMLDRRFQRSVIYLCAHSAEGAMGLIVNQKASNISFLELLSQLQILPEKKLGDFAAEIEGLPVHVGGPVDTGRGFVLHSSDYLAPESTMRIGDEFCLTATVDILRAIALGKGPKRSILALGYAGWGAGQLEREIQFNGWLHCPADLDLVFDTDLDEKYDGALSRIGVNPAHLVSDAGHA